jgi:acyl-CoA synthetase (AMP-forming)/AMP-acid ligase II
MPLTHDMGLIGIFIMMFANGMQLNLMPTELFVRRPLLWLRSRPQAGDDPVLAELRLPALPEGAREPPRGLDLSAVRCIFNGAEPISRALCDEFLERMRPTGLKRNAMFPVYGLAEASLAVSFPAPGQRVRRWCSTAAAWPWAQPVHRGAARRAGRGGVHLRGPADPLLRAAHRGRCDAPLPERHVGHVQIRGENVTRGYFEAPEVNAASFTADGWLRTGDLGLVDRGELVITGRAKEIIFVNGQNYYPHDLESIAQQAGGLELGKVAAPACRPPAPRPTSSTLFVLHRGSLADFVPVAPR